MLKRHVASALVCAALLAASAPSAATAQTLKAAPAERRLTAPNPEKGPGLKALFSESVAKAKAGGPAETDFKRSEATRLQDDPQPPKKEKWTTGTKIFVVVLVAVVVGVSVWALANPGDDPLPDCFNDPTNALCQ